MRPKGASQLQGEPRGSLTAARRSRASTGRAPRRSGRGPARMVHSAPGRKRRLGYADVCGRRIESDRVRPRRFAVKTEQPKLWSSTAQVVPLGGKSGKLAQPAFNAPRAWTTT